MMTGEKIEKALKLCVKNKRDPKKNWCKECPYLIQKVDCIGRIEKDALAYINRLKAENDNVKVDYNFIKQTYEKEKSMFDDQSIIIGLLNDRIATLENQLAVSDRALELAVDNYDNSNEVKQAFIDEAKQELEKERKDET